MDEFETTHPCSVILAYQDDDLVIALDCEHHEGATLTMYQWKGPELSWQPVGEIAGITRSMYAMLCDDMPRYLKRVN
jgi:hypothetical protein